MTEPESARTRIAPARSTRELLLDPRFSRLVAARFISFFGTAMAPIAVAFGVLARGGTPGELGGAIAAQTAGQLVFLLLGGAMADRSSRLRQMVRADWLAALAQAGAAAVLASPAVPLHWLMPLMAANGIAVALFAPAWVGLVPALVRPNELQAANGLLSLSRAGAVAIGGAAAGAIVAFGGAATALAIDSASFVLSALLLSSIRIDEPVRQGAESLASALREGWREFTAHRWLWVIVVQFSLVVAASTGGFYVVGPIVAERELGGPLAWGAIAAGQGAGFLVGGAVALAFSVRFPMRVATFAVFVFAAPLVALAVTSQVWLIAAAAFAAGAAVTVFGVLWNTALHTWVSPRALSRVSAYDELGSLALAPLGQAAAGPLVESIGTSATLAWGVAAILVPTAIALAVPEVWRLEARSRSYAAVEESEG